MSNCKCDVIANQGIIEGTVDKSSLVPKFYDDLLAKPMINGIPITGDKKGKDYGLVDSEDRITNLELNEILK